jgi:hypothetical protein
MFSMNRGVDVAVMVHVTGWAHPLSHGEGQAPHFVATPREDLAAWIPTTHHHDRLASLRRLMLQLTAKFAKTHIGAIARASW